MKQQAIKQAPATLARLRSLSPARQRLLAARLKLLPNSADAKTGRTVLSAFVSRRGQAERVPQLTADDIKEFLRQRLPEHMIPARITLLESFPFLPNGKLDRQSLLDLARTAGREEGREAAPVDSELMQSMQAIWSEVLDTEAIYPKDNFFELGGDSLLSINVVARARKKGIYLNPSELFDFPVLVELCAHLAAESAERAAAPEAFDRSSMRSKNVQGSSNPFFMVHGGSRLLNQLQDVLGAEQPIHLIPAHWEQADLDFGASLESLAAEALEPLLEQQPRGPYLLGGYSFGAVIAFEMAHMLSARGETINLLFMLDPPEKPEIFGSIWADYEILTVQEPPPPRQARRLEQLKKQGARVSLEGRFLFARGCRALGAPIPAAIRKLYVFRAYMAASRRYELRPLPAPLLVFRATQGIHKCDPAVWRSVAGGGFTLQEFDCKHIDLQWDPEMVNRWTALFSEQLAAFADRAAVKRSGAAE